MNYTEFRTEGTTLSTIPEGDAWMEYLWKRAGQRGDDGYTEYQPQPVERRIVSEPGTSLTTRAPALELSLGISGGLPSTIVVSEILARHKRTEPAIISRRKTTNTGSPYLYWEAKGTSNARLSAMGSLPRDDGFDITIRRVLDLDHPDEDDDPEYVKPTRHALLHVLAVLFLTHSVLQSPFPRAAVSTSDDGGISLFWTKPNRGVQLTIAATTRGLSFIYHREGKTSVLDKHVGPQELAKWLAWFNAAV
jgi:hypothetical protein